jgi:pSer/pThr/pTyr-binding forkhead associated (FHA) protein
MQKIYIEDYKGNVQIIPLEKDEMTIGRLNENSICFPDKHISRNHAKIIKENGNYYIADVKSRYGVKLNGVKIDQKALIKTGDVIVIGDYVIKLMSPDSAVVDQEIPDKTAAILEHLDRTEQIVTPREEKTAIISVTPEPEPVAEEAKPEEKPAPVPKKTAFPVNKFLVIAAVGLAVILVGIYIWLSRQPSQVKETAPEIKKTEPLPSKTEPVKQAEPSVIREEEKVPVIEKEQVKVPQEQIPPEPVKEKEAAPVEKIKEEKKAEPAVEKKPAEKPKEIPKEIKETEKPKEQKIASIEPKIEKKPEEKPKEKPKEESLAPKDKLEKIKRLYSDARKAKLNGDTKTAVSLLNQCISLSPGFADAYKQLGIIFSAMGEKDAAVKHYKKYLSLKPDAPDAMTIKNVIEQLGGN